MPATPRSEIFDSHYRDYCSQIASTDLSAVQKRLNIKVKEDMAKVLFFNETYEISGREIVNAQTREQADYVTSVILAKYILLCPDELHLDAQWCTFRDFKKESHFTNANYFNSDTTHRIQSRFSGRLPDLKAASAQLDGVINTSEPSWDLSVAFPVLPRLSLLLLMNEADEEFPSDCRVLFQRQAEYYLDPESLAMTSGLLAAKLIQTDKERKSENE